MADFYQTGLITTLHRLGRRDPADVQAELVEYASARPVALVIPSLATEMDEPALAGIVRELREVTYLQRIIIALDQADEAQYRRARAYFDLPSRTEILWLTGPRVAALHARLTNEGINVPASGKGRGVWFAFGYVLSDETTEGIVLHDADILTYSRDLLARLCYPLMSPALAYEYVKAYYARIADRMYGRATRLFVTPLLRALLKFVGYHPFLVFLDSFRYPLAGEFGLTADLARVVRIPGDWGLEIGMLGEVYRNVGERRICEVDAADAYDHKHRPLDPGDSESGLIKMAVDITKHLFRTLAQEGIELSDGLFRSVRMAYLRMAQDQIRRYADDAAINGLAFDRHAEGTAVEVFARAIDIASRDVREDPLGTPAIPNWSRVISAFPDFLEELRDAVAADAA